MMARSTTVDLTVALIRELGYAQLHVDMCLVEYTDRACCHSKQCVIPAAPSPAEWVEGWVLHNQRCLLQLESTRIRQHVGTASSPPSSPVPGAGRSRPLGVHATAAAQPRPGLEPRLEQAVGGLGPATRLRHAVVECPA
jgi:hypothetical protein